MNKLQNLLWRIPKKEITTISPRIVKGDPMPLYSHLSKLPVQNQAHTAYISGRIYADSDKFMPASAFQAVWWHRAHPCHLPSAPSGWCPSPVPFVSTGWGTAPTPDKPESNAGVSRMQNAKSVRFLPSHTLNDFMATPGELPSG